MGFDQVDVRVDIWLGWDGNCANVETRLRREHFFVFLLAMYEWFVRTSTTVCDLSGKIRYIYIYIYMFFMVVYHIPATLTMSFNMG